MILILKVYKKKKKIPPLGGRDIFEIKCVI